MPNFMEFDKVRYSTVGTYILDLEYFLLPLRIVKLLSIDS